MPPRAVKYTSVISIVGLQSLLKGTPSREREQLDQNKADSYIYYYFLEKGLKLWEKDHRIGIHICPMTPNPIAIGGRRREFRYGSKAAKFSVIKYPRKAVCPTYNHTIATITGWFIRGCPRS
jgi:hypothetical protein